MFEIRANIYEYIRWIPLPKPNLSPPNLPLSLLVTVTCARRCLRSPAVPVVACFRRLRQLPLRDAPTTTPTATSSARLLPWAIVLPRCPPASVGRCDAALP